MAADRRISSDDGSKSSLVKVARNQWMIAAASGNAASTLDVRSPENEGYRQSVVAATSLSAGWVALCITGGHSRQMSSGTKLGMRFVWRLNLYPHVDKTVGGGVDIRVFG